VADPACSVPAPASRMAARAGPVDAASVLEWDKGRAWPMRLPAPADSAPAVPPGGCSGRAAGPLGQAAKTGRAAAGDGGSGPAAKGCRKVTNVTAPASPAASLPAVAAPPPGADTPGRVDRGDQTMSTAAAAAAARIPRRTSPGSSDAARGLAPWPPARPRDALRSDSPGEA
jgi:hypothetical protein